MLHRRSLLKAGLLLPVMAGAPALAAPARAAVPAVGAASRYTMTAFTYGSETKMSVYESADATNFRLLAAAAYSPPSGLLRDPSIMRHTDGRYYVTYTAAWTGNQIGLAVSTNRRTWTFLRNITLPDATITHSWAPEWFVDTDGSVHIIVSLHHSGTADPVFQPYRITATNAALTAWSAPMALAGIPQNYYIDTFVVKIGTRYHAVLKSTLDKSIDFAYASSLTGPYTVWKTRNFVPYDGEGPCLVRLDDGGWRLYFEQYHAHQYYFTDSYDTFRTWSTPALLPGLSGTVKHMTVLRETV